jgi:16S rRNA (cytosine1402-N4)-methyltransferase
MTKHVPVLLQTVCRFFSELGDVRFLDCTFGGGGHAKALLEANPQATVLAIDQDPFVIPYAEKLQLLFPGRFSFKNLNFRNLDLLLEKDFSGIFFDLGVSSFQLDQVERGFSFKGDAKTDMRFNPQVGQSAEEFLEKACEEDLIQAIRDYGEERNWKRIVRAIIDARGRGILGSTTRLSELIASTSHRNFSKIHPATRSFQGIRIAVNDELSALEEALLKAFAKLKDGGILGVISFHSLEDRIVKNFFKGLAGKLPNSTGVQGEILTKKPLIAQDTEVQENPRARSAKLRFLKKQLILHNEVRIYTQRG